MEALFFLFYPFAACVLLILIHVYFGMHILERGLIFVDLSLAQFIGIGIACSVFFGVEGITKQIYPAVFAALGAFILSFSRRIARHTNIEAFIGVLYVFSLSAGVLILDRSPHGTEALKTLLNGNIIWTGPKELLSTLVLYAFVGALHIIFRTKFWNLSAYGKGAYGWELLFFLSFAAVLIKSIQIAGILQVFAFLIVPALTGRIIAARNVSVLVWGWTLGGLSSLLGLSASYRWDLPAAPVIIASMSIFYLTTLFCKARTGQSTAR
ncbi:MAG: zinc/manganese transport system permease protein [Syntrophaceae bacterium]|nr:MAG: zinc/manganese transport system permease protein [Syntrophaceae bacterium]